MTRLGSARKRPLVPEDDDSLEVGGLGFEEAPEDADEGEPLPRHPVARRAADDEQPRRTAVLRPTPASHKTLRIVAEDTAIGPARPSASPRPAPPRARPAAAQPSTDKREAPMVGRFRRKLAGHQDLAWVLLITLICGVFVAILLHYLWLRHQVYELGYDVATLTEEHSALLEENRRLTVEAAVQSNAERLEAEALERLGLRPTQADQLH